MPTFPYICNLCNNRYELWRAVSQRHSSICPQCQSSDTKLDFATQIKTQTITMQAFQSSRDVTLQSIGFNDQKEFNDFKRARENKKNPKGEQWIEFHNDRPKHGAGKMVAEGKM